MKSLIYYYILFPRPHVNIKVSTDDQILKIYVRGSFSHSNVYRE